MATASLSRSLPRSRVRSGSSGAGVIAVRSACRSRTSSQQHWRSMMADAQHLEVDGKSADFIFNTLVQGGLSKSDAAVVASTWIFENFGRVKRTFSYVQEFPQVDPACVSTFSRSFAHEDWVDGESVVQAGEIAGELGFNTRF